VYPKLNALLLQILHLFEDHTPPYSVGFKHLLAGFLVGPTLQQNQITLCSLHLSECVYKHAHTFQ